MTILVIDDDKRMRTMVRRILAAAGFDLIEAENGRQGLKLFRKHRPAMVITDIIMPEQEGMETIRLLHKEARDLPILAISGGGYVLFDYLPMALHLGASATLAKPFSSEQLLAAVAGLISKARPSEPAILGAP